MHILLGHVVLL